MMWSDTARRRQQRHVEWIAITLILLLAAVLRFWALGEVPPGLAHDEVANWLIGSDILAGRHAIYFTAAYGHEPLYHYVQAATIALIGDHWLGLRYPSAAFGLLGLAATYVLVRRLLGPSAALLSSAWMAVSFWPLFYARVALRAITLPFTAALSAYFLLRGVMLELPTADGRGQAEPTPGSADCRRSGVDDWLLAGFFLGLSTYTYMASRILPAILVAFLVYLLFVRSHAFPWSRVAVFLLVAAVVSAPLVLWLATNPGAEYRISEVRAPLDRLLAGDPSLLWQNLVANLKFFTCSGDPWSRQNIPGRPVFADPIGGVLFWAGVLIALWRWRDPRHGFLLIWLAGALAPSIVTSDAPSSIRDILAVVTTFVFPALALVAAGRWIKHAASCVLPRVTTRLTPTEHVAASCVLRRASCILLLVPCLFLTVRDYFLVWPQDSVVRFDYQADLTAVSHRLDETAPDEAAVVAGLSVHTMDGPGLELSARRDVQDVRLCDTRETLLVPGGSDVWLYVPQVVPFDDDLRARLLGWGAVVEPDSRSSFTAYHLVGGAGAAQLQYLETAATLPDGAPVALPTSFAGQLAFLGYEWLEETPHPGDAVPLLTYWRVEAPPTARLKVFVHLLDSAGEMVAQHDGLGSPPERWRTGDLIVQRHTLSLPADRPAGPHTPVIGLYEAQGPGTRLMLWPDDADHLALAPLEVTSP